MESCMTELRRRLAQSHLLRRTFIPIFRYVNPGNITIRHHWTGEPITVHAFRHKDYWYYAKRREQATMTLCARLICSGDVVFDVGGHMGYVALYFVQLVGREGRVFSFEPSPGNLPYIRANLSQARYGNALFVEKAAGATGGSATFWAEDLTGQNGSIIPSYYENVAATARSHGVRAETHESHVEVVALDTFAEASGVMLDFIKIDVEGAEELVLEGMCEILAVRRPRLMIEITSRRETVFDALRSCGYLLFDDSRRALSRSDQLTGCSPNVFAVPAGDDEAVRIIRDDE